MELDHPASVDRGDPYELAATASDDREILRELLTFTEGDDAAELADRLLSRHSSIGQIFSLLPDGIGAMLADAPGATRLLAAARRMMMSALRGDVGSRPFEKPRALIDFLRLSMAHERREMVRALFLDSGNVLLLDEVVASGSPQGVRIPIGAILRRAISIDAAGLMVAHNHPSGNPKPSDQDLIATDKLVRAAATLGITVHDHLIFARRGWTSFRALGLLPPMPARGA